jgi:hypothetical protein
MGHYPRGYEIPRTRLPILWVQEGSDRVEATGNPMICVYSTHDNDGDGDGDGARIYLSRIGAPRPPYRIRTISWHRPNMPSAI